MIYVDTSALVKLVVQEAETAALQGWIKLQEGETFFASHWRESSSFERSRGPLLIGSIAREKSYEDWPC